MFEQLFAKTPLLQVSGNLGNGVFTYRGAQAAEPHGFAIWQMSLYGALFSDDVAAEDVSSAYILTAPRHMAAAHEWLRMLQRPQAA